MGRTKTVNELLEAFNKAGKVRRQTIATNAGFARADEYEEHLKNRVMNTKVAKPVIHNVNIIDASGSMSGGKFNNAVAAYNEELDVLREVTDIEYKQTLVMFSSNKGDIEKFVQPIYEADDIPLSVNAHGGTPLFRFINKTINNLVNYGNSEIIKNDERVLINIFTDGGDTEHNRYLQDAKDSINQAKELGWTITFVGTDVDVKNMIRTFNLDESNTLIHDNTAEGVKKAMEKTSVARSSYSTSVLDGASKEELSVGFYKQKGKL